MTPRDASPGRRPSQWTAMSIALTLALTTTACADAPTPVVDVPPHTTVAAVTMDTADVANVATMDASATQATATKAAPITHIAASVDALRAALAVRDYDALESMMGDVFVLGLYRSEAMTLDPPAARTALETRYLPPADHAVDATDDRNAFPAIDPPLETTFDPALIVNQLLFSRGWGADGRGEAVLVLAERADGAVYWHGMVLAPEGFGDLVGGAPGRDSVAVPIDGRTLRGIGYKVDAPAGWSATDSGGGGVILTSFAMDSAGHGGIGAGQTKIDILSLDDADPAASTLAEAVAQVTGDAESEADRLDAPPTPFRTTSGLSAMRFRAGFAVIELNGDFVVASCYGDGCDAAGGVFDTVLASVRTE